MKKTKQLCLALSVGLLVTTSASANIYLKMFKISRIAVRPFVSYLAYRAVHGTVNGFESSRLSDAVQSFENKARKVGDRVQDKTKKLVLDVRNKWKSSAVQKQCGKVKKTCVGLKDKVFKKK